MKNKVLCVGLLISFAAVQVSATSTGLVSAKTAICDLLYSVYDLLYFISGGVAALVITLQGVKWIGSAEDPGLRKQAKMGVIHAVVGLLIVMTAAWIVIMVGGSDCVVP